MEQLPSNSFRFRGFLRSSHALLAVGMLGLVILVGISLAYGFMFGADMFSVVFVLALICILGRYLFKGPEADRAQPMISVTHQDNRMQANIVNVEPTQEIISILRAVANRRSLPPAAGVIRGSASDPNAIHAVTPEVAAALQAEDSQIMMPLPVGESPATMPAITKSQLARSSEMAQ